MTLKERYRCWQSWAAHCRNTKTHKVLVLLGLVNSPTFTIHKNLWGFDFSKYLKRGISMGKSDILTPCTPARAGTPKTKHEYNLELTEQEWQFIQRNMLSQVMAKEPESLIYSDYPIAMRLYVKAEENLKQIARNAGGPVDESEL